jgi:hypothetical protein
MKSSNIIKRQIHKVKDWNREKLAEQKYIMVFTLGNGSMLDEPRKKGYVVYKKHKLGGTSAKYMSNYEKALANFHKDEL